MLFWFAAFIAVAVLHHNLNDTGYSYDFYYGIVYTGSACDFNGSYCKTMEAAAVFGAFEWYVFIFLCGR